MNTYRSQDMELPERRLFERRTGLRQLLSWCSIYHPTITCLVIVLIFEVITMICAVVIGTHVANYFFNDRVTVDSSGRKP